MSNSWKDYTTAFILAIFCAFIIRAFVIGVYKVPSSSMQPTLKAGDFIFTWKMVYQFKPIARGDVVVFSYSDRPNVQYVKRVVGLPGDRIQIKNGNLYLNNQKAYYKDVSENLKFPFFDPALFSLQLESIDQKKKWQILVQKVNNSSFFGPAVVSPGEVFVLGDNRDASDDSRYWGAVPTGLILGKVFFRWMSIDYQNRTRNTNWPKIRWERVFTQIE